MGTVYAARDKETGAEVAIKRMIPAVMEDKRFVQRFLREANLGTRLRHPNVIRVVGAGTDEAGVPFMVMELLRGQALDVRMKQGPVPEEEAIRIIRQSLLGLQKAHQETVIHRDIKPANIFLCEDGSTRVMDFGIAKALEDSKLTRTGAIIGTLVYMSPEQTQGKPVDARSDIYSLGLVCFEMLAGKFPFPGKTPAVMLLEKMTKPVPSLPDNISPWLQSVLEKALTKNPDDRFQSAYEMVMALDARMAVPVKPFEPAAVKPAVAAAPQPAPSAASQPAPAPSKPQPVAVSSTSTAASAGGSKKTGLIAAIVIGIIVLVAAFMLFNKPASDADQQKGEKQNATRSGKRPNAKANKNGGE
jgi:serine/threonine-protein kinase